ncbi:MAG: hypothetical protein M1546_05220 [Chloroflexi bacterium]|nr:hypothetical protein [Chloroflexota bacterium]
MNTRQHSFLAAIVLLVGCLVLLIVGVIQQNPPQANPLSSALSSPPALHPPFRRFSWRPHAMEL